MTSLGNDVCTTCHKTHPWPDGTVPEHPFNNGGLTAVQATTTGQAKPKVEASPWPFDPVLRQALIDKGVLTPGDLTEAEAKIRAISGMVSS